MSNLIGVLEYSKIMIDRYQDEKGIAVDMTLGKGNDSAYLAKLFAKVYSFDIQDEAISLCQKRFTNQENISIINDSHENFDDYVTDEISLFIYNLGYLPGFSKEVTTKSSSTIKSLQKALTNLKRKGVIIIVVYPGHYEGLQEAKALESFIAQIQQEFFTVSKYTVLGKDAPYVVCINKK
ncbi:endonuclease IV [Bacilli bacterium PM5-3]|nr:endonuclease IV [Bacilli bacterium PM5-3]